MSVSCCRWNRWSLYSCAVARTPLMKKKNNDAGRVRIKERMVNLVADKHGMAVRIADAQSLGNGCSWRFTTTWDRHWRLRPENGRWLLGGGARLDGHLFVGQCFDRHLHAFQVLVEEGICQP